MSISKYQMDEIIKAYKKQRGLKLRLDANSAPSLGQDTYVATLTSKEDAVISSSSDTTSDIRSSGLKSGSI